MYVSGHTPVLQTAVAPVYENRSHVMARIKLDSGSQRSYVTSQMKESLSLRKIHTKTISIKTFGSEIQDCDPVELKIGVEKVVLSLKSSFGPTYL